MTEPALAYAQDALAGRVLAGELVKLACKRFVSDWDAMERGDSLYRWDAEAADDFESFCRVVCKVHDAGRDEWIPFDLLPWQQFFFRQIFGWKLRESAIDHLDREPGTRRFRKAWISTGKGAGKGPSAAAVLLYMMLRDKSVKTVKGAVCASSEPQARELMDDVRDMLENDESGLLKERLNLTGGTQGNSVYLRLRPGRKRTGYVKTVGLGGAPERHSGPKFNLVIPDEFQSYVTDGGMKKLIAGTKKHVNPLVLLLSNAPEQREGPCWMEYERVCKMLRGQAEWANDDDFLVAIYEVDEGLAKQATRRSTNGGFTDAAKKLWPMSIPSIGTASTYAYVNRELRSGVGAEGDPDALRRVLGLIPHGSDTKGWIKWGAWVRCLLPERPPNLHALPLFLSLDLGDVIAFTSLGLTWRLPNGTLYCEQEAYTHEHDLAGRGELAGAPFRKWAEQGWIKANAGRKVDWTAVAERIRELADTHDLCGLAIDPWNARRFRNLMTELGIPWRDGQAQDAKSGAGLLMVDHPQGGKFQKPPFLCQKMSMEAVQLRVHSEPPEIWIQDNPLTNFMLGCANVTVMGAGSNLNRYLEIPKSDRTSGRKFIDSLIAMVMGVGLADWHKQVPPPQPQVFFDAADALAKLRAA